MSALKTLLGVIPPAFGLKTVAASTSGAANARVSALLPLVVGSTQVVTTYPAGAAGITVTASTYGAAIAWTTLQSSGTLASHMLTALIVGRGSPAIDQSYFVEAASGAAGSEVLMARVRGRVARGTSPETLPVWPPVQWPANERLAFRVVSGVANAHSVTADFMGRPV